MVPCPKLFRILHDFLKLYNSEGNSTRTLCTYHKVNNWMFSCFYCWCKVKQWSIVKLIRFGLSTPFLELAIVASWKTMFFSSKTPLYSYTKQVQTYSCCSFNPDGGNCGRSRGKGVERGRLCLMTVKLQ